MPAPGLRTIRTASSVAVERCQVCDSGGLEPSLFLGYLPPVNVMPEIGEAPREQTSYPAQLLWCRHCQLVQLGVVVDPHILFPPGYPYTSGSTRILRESFAELSRECPTLVRLGPDDLIVDIGSNDGTLLSNFASAHRVLGVEPTDTGQAATERGIPTLRAFFTCDVARDIQAREGPAKIVTATNVLAHVEDVHDVMEGVVGLLEADGVFMSESHYLLSLVETLQYDTIYHEHLRYYSLHSLQFLLERHGLSVIHAKRIPTHGGSLRVYAARPGRYPVSHDVATLLREEDRLGVDAQRLRTFSEDVVRSKLQLQALLWEIKRQGQRIYGVGAPSRATTLVNYVGLDHGVLDCVVEVEGSHKIGKYLPGTVIPVVPESRLLEDQPGYALVLSWHLAEELIPTLVQRGYRGEYIIPLPVPRRRMG